MTPVRVGVALFLIGLICLAVVTLRVKRVALDSLTQQHVSTLIELRRQAWNLELEIARLRAPQQIRDRVEWMQLPVGAGFVQLISSSAAGRRATARGR